MDAYTLNIKEDLIPINQYSRPGYPAKPDHIVVHWTNDPGATAKNERDFFANICPQTKETAGVHYLVGIKGEVIRAIPENEVAYHAGGRSYTPYASKEFFNLAQHRVYPHDRCIGIETCHIDITGKFTDETIQALTHLVADIMRRNKIPVEKVIRHYDVTGKVCPKWYVEHEDDWQKFKETVKTLATN
jgi:N-acetylmuramoyl-L-alanine amidase CwlA